MSNYYGVVRTNYFHVKDEEQFRALMAKAIGDEDGIELWDDEKDRNGSQVFGFGVYGGISGVLNHDGLKECVAEDDAILIFEAGHEKLRYVGGGVTIITSKNIEYLNLQDVGCRKARELLGNDDWVTKCDC